MIGKNLFKVLDQEQMAAKKKSKYFRTRCDFSAVAFQILLRKCIQL